MLRSTRSVETLADNVPKLLPDTANRLTTAPGGSGKVLLISNRVMHYRVPVYNYFNNRLQGYGMEWSVIADSLQKETATPANFDLLELPFGFSAYKRAIESAQPTAVILFLHLRDTILWPLVHWLKLRRIPFAFWTKGGNWSAKDSRVRYEFFNYIHSISDSLILYSDACKKYIKPRFHSKAFVAPNTINFEEIPAICETKEEIRREFGIPFNKTVIFMGRMGAENGRKRVDRLVDLFRGIDRSGTGLVLVGSGMSEELRSRLNPRNTIYLGEVHDPENLKINKLCKMADLCVIPGHLGLALNHAFYWGLPVITEEDNHPPERAYLTPGRNGYIVPRSDTESLKTHILRLLDDDALRARFSQNAREDIQQDASIERMFSGFKASIDYMTARKGRRRGEKPGTI